MKMTEERYEKCVGETSMLQNILSPMFLYFAPC